MSIITVSDSEALIKFDHVTLGYGAHVIISDLHVRLHKGQIIALIGGSGSGKTTILRATTGQLKPQAGRVELLGHDISKISKKKLDSLRQQMGVLFQHGALFTDLGVYDNVAFPLRELTNYSEREIFNKVLKTLDSVGLRTAAHLKLSEISGGMARRVALARAIILEPQIILYDEPFAGLDPISLGMTAKLIRDTADRLNCGSILITHDIDESFDIVDYVYMIGQGKIIAEGTPDELRESKNDYVNQFLYGKPDGPVVFEYPESNSFSDWYKLKSEKLGV